MRTRTFSTAAAVLLAVALLPASAPAAGFGPTLQGQAPGELVVPVHCAPVKGGKGGKGGGCSFHKQCLYGVYGSQGQYKGLHFHNNAWHRGSPCGFRILEPAGRSPKFQPKSGSRTSPPTRRR